MTRRENSRRRPAARFESRPLILVVCGARRTEKQYIEGLCKHYRELATRVQFVTNGVDPLTLVRKAAKERQLRNRNYDEVWCVVDVDEFDVEPALKLAKKHDIRVVVSNLCFENWLLLHFEECSENLREPEQVAKRLQRHLPDYDKTKLAFADFEHGVDKAVERAKNRCEFGREHLQNPSSGMWRLVETVVPPGRRPQ